MLRKYSVHAGSICKIQLWRLGFDNLKPVQLHLTYSTQQNERRDRTLSKGTSDMFNNKRRYQLQQLWNKKLRCTEELNACACGPLY